MSMLISNAGSERILNKLSRLIESCEYYEAHQLYRTLYFRYLNAKRFRELASLLYEGATILLSRGQFTSGADLASLYIDTLNKDPSLDKVLGNQKECQDLSVKIGNLLSLIPSQSQERVNFTLMTLNLKPNILPIHMIHKQFALILWREKNFQESRYHFLHCRYNCGEDCALMLIEYHIACGYPSEVDLFITQFILQLLCLTKHRTHNCEKFKKNKINEPGPSNNCDNSKVECPGSKSNQHAFANVTLKSYIAKHPQIQKNNPPFLLPLINFLWFLLLAIDSGKSSTFNVLCDLYATSLNRDPCYKDYLNRIGELYFGLSSPSSNQGMGGFLGNFLQSFLENNENEETEEVGTISPVKQCSHQISEDLD